MCPLDEQHPVVGLVPDSASLFLVQSRGKLRLSPRAAPEELGAGGVTEPLLVLLGCPAARADEELPDVGVVECPEDVGGAGDVEVGP